MDVLLHMPRLARYAIPVCAWHECTGIVAAPIAAPPLLRRCRLSSERAIEPS
jgi:hypothetical protein